MHGKLKGRHRHWRKHGMDDEGSGPLEGSRVYDVGDAGFLVSWR